MVKSLLDKLDERTGYRALLDGFLHRQVPRGVGWWYVLGSATMLTALIQGITGIFLTLYYVPTPDHAYESVQFISGSVLFGAFVRGLHHWSASAIVVLAVLHLLQVLYFGAFKYPREINWIIGVGLLLVALGLALTGYLLPWDQRAFWGTTVSTEVAGTAPIIGPLLLRLARGGAEVGAVTLARFYSLHVVFLPLGAILLFGPHLYMVVKQGISAPPRRKLEVPTESGDYQAFYAERKRGGHRFYPHMIFQDTIAFLAVFAVLVALAVFVGAPTEAKADPTVTDYVPRPEWYFLWLFRFLSMLKPQLEVVGTVLLPIVGVLVLLFLPKLDRSKFRHPLDRPIMSGIAALVIIGIGVLTYQGATAPVPEAAPIARLEIPVLTSIEQQGQVVYKDLACAVCHAIDGVGGTRGPDLAGVGTRLQPEALLSHIRPATGTSVMPSYTIDNADVLAVAAYLLTLTTPPTRPVATPMPLPPGQAAYIAQGCSACHSISGMGGTAGPDLSAEGLQHDKDFVAKFLENPSVVLPKSRMPAHPMPPDVRDAIAGYLATLKGGILVGGPSTEAGKTLYDQYGCAACHAIRSVGGNLGPDLTRLGDARDALYIEQFIRNPKALLASATMPPYGNLSGDELRSMALYLLSLVGKASTPAAWPSPTTGPAPSPAAPTPTAAGGAAEALYQANCLGCHGPYGQGGPVYPRSITSAQYLSGHTDTQIRGVIQNGEGSMPGFGSRFSATDVDALIALLRGWQK